MAYIVGVHTLPMFTHARQKLECSYAYLMNQKGVFSLTVVGKSRRSPPSKISVGTALGALFQKDLSKFSDFSKFCSVQPVSTFEEKIYAPFTDETASTFS